MLFWPVLIMKAADDQPHCLFDGDKRHSMARRPPLPPFATAFCYITKKMIAILFIVIPELDIKYGVYKFINIYIEKGLTQGSYDNYSACWKK